LIQSQRLLLQAKSCASHQVLAGELTLLFYGQKTSCQLGFVLKSFNAALSLVGWILLPSAATLEKQK
jgi:hypothetical protein